MIVFNHPPETYAEGWDVIKKILEKWHHITLNWKEADHRPKIKSIEDAAGTTLPPSVREWICMVEEMIRAEQWPLRDSYDIRFRPDIQAVTLLIQGEADYYWAVKKENLAHNDPPVDGYHLSFEGDPDTWTWNRTEHETLTAFVIQYLLDYHAMFEGTGGYNAEIPFSETILQDFISSFPTYVEIEGYHIFESDDVLAFINPITGSDEYLLSVHYTGSQRNFPETVKRYAYFRGSYYGPDPVRR